MDDIEIWNLKLQKTDSTDDKIEGLERHSIKFKILFRSKWSI